ncbi:MAG: effector-associated domain EAD1-containing protein [Cyanobacteria bacterium J06629_9]
MELLEEYIDTRFEPLQNALIEAFPDETKLNMMVLPTLKKPLNQLASGEDHTEVVFNLLIAVNAQGKVVDLVRGAHRKNPDRQALRQFCQIHRQALFEHACTNNQIQQLLSPKQIQTLINILQSVETFDVIAAAATSALPPDASDRENAFKDLTNQELDPVLRLYGLLRLLLHWFPKDSGGQPRILVFSESLQEKISSTSSSAQQLQTWITEIRSSLGLPSSSSSDASDKFQSSLVKAGTLEASLMITAQPTTQQQGTEPLYRVNACLYFDQLKGQPNLDNQPLRPPYELALPDDESNAPIECVFDDVPNQTDKFVKVAIDYLNNKALRQELGYRSFELMVEVFLPVQRLHKDVDQWELSRHNQVPIPLGRGYDRIMSSVLIRSFDRFDPFAGAVFKLAFQEAWDEWQEHLSQGHPSKVEHVEKWDDYKGKQLEACFYDKHILKVSCGLPEQSTGKEALFRAMINNNLVAAVWSRDCNLEGCDCVTMALEPFIEPESLKNPSRLMSRLKQVRNDAWKTSQGNRLGDHLAVLLDNPYRLPMCLQDNDF